MLSIAVKLQLFKLFVCAFMILDFRVILHFEHSPNFSLPMSQDIFRYNKFYSVTMMLSELALTRFEEIVENVGVIFGSRCLVPITT